MRLEPKWMFTAAIVLLLAGGGLALLGEGIFRAWPLDTWRVDLDDLITSTAALLAAWAAFRRANQAHDKADSNGKDEHELERREEADHVDHEQRLRALEEQWFDDT